MRKHMRRKEVGRKELMERLESRLLFSAAAELVFAQQPAGGTTHSTVGTIIVAVDDALGNRVMTDRSKVALSIQTGPDGAVMTGGRVAFAKKGFAVFNNVVLPMAGTYELIATDGALAPAVSQSFVVTAAATKLVMTRQPTGGTSGSALTVQFKLEDANNQVVTTDNSAVTLKILSGPRGGKLVGTVTVTASNGVATLSSASLPKAGSYEVYGVDGNLRSTPSAGFVMAVGAAAKLQIVGVAKVGSASGALKHGAVGPVTVDVEDAFGNVVTTDTSTVTLVLNTTLSTETKLGTVTQAQTGTASAVKGVAVFSALTTEPTGWYSCLVTDGGLRGDQRLLFVR